MHFLNPVEPQVSKRIALSIFALDVGSVLNDSEPEAIAKFIWRLTHINRVGTGRWVRGVPSTRWADAVGRITPGEAFRVLSALYWVDTDLVRDCSSAADSLLADRTLVPEDLALVGFLEYSGHPVEVETLPPAIQIGAWLATPCRLDEMAFALRALRSRDARIADNSLKNAARELYEKGETYSISDALDKLEGAVSAPLLAELLRDEAIPEEPRSTFLDLAATVRAQYPEDNWISFTQMLGAVFDASDPGTIFPDSKTAKKWLTSAIRAGILQTKTRKNDRGEEIGTLFRLVTHSDDL